MRTPGAAVMNQFVAIAVIMMKIAVVAVRTRLNHLLLGLFLL